MAGWLTRWLTASLAGQGQTICQSAGTLLTQQPLLQTIIRLPPIQRDSPTTPVDVSAAVFTLTLTEVMTLKSPAQSARYLCVGRVTRLSESLRLVGSHLNQLQKEESFYFQNTKEIWLKIYTEVCYQSVANPG